MHLILCLDDRNGMTFNGRKQSRDRLVTENMENLQQEGEYRYLEQWDDTIDLDEIDDIIVYRWNRKDPADHYCPIDFSYWEIVEEIEFPGYSHEKITRQTYRRTDK